MVDESKQFVLESLLFRFRISDFGFTRASAPVSRDHAFGPALAEEWFQTVGNSQIFDFRAEFTQF